MGAEGSEDSPPGTRRSASTLETVLAELVKLKMGQNLCPPSPCPDPDSASPLPVCAESWGRVCSNVQPAATPRSTEGELGPRRSTLWDPAQCGVRGVNRPELCLAQRVRSQEERESSDGLWSAEPGLWVGRGPQRGVWSSLVILCIWNVVAGLKPGGRALGVVISTAMVDIAGLRRGPSVCPSVSEVLLTWHPWRCCALLCGANKVNGTKGVVS